MKRMFNLWRKVAALNFLSTYGTAFQMAKVSASLNDEPARGALPPHNVFLLYGGWGEGWMKARGEQWELLFPPPTIRENG